MDMLPQDVARRFGDAANDLGDGVLYDWGEFASRSLRRRAMGVRLSAEARRPPRPPEGSLAERRGE